MHSETEENTIQEVQIQYITKLFTVTVNVNNITSFFHRGITWLSNNVLVQTLNLS